MTRQLDVRTRATAVVSWILSRNVHLAHLYLLGRRKGRQRPLLQAGGRNVALSLAEWFVEPGTNLKVKAALREPHHPMRMLADCFLVESVLVQFIRQQNTKGLTVDLPQAIHKYLGLWAHRPCCAALARRLSRLVWHRGARHKFGQQLRKTWGLSLGCLRPCRELAPVGIHSRVGRAEDITIQPMSATRVFRGFRLKFRHRVRVGEIGPASHAAPGSSFFPLSCNVPVPGEIFLAVDPVHLGCRHA